MLTTFESLRGLEEDDLLEAWECFLKSCRVIVRGRPELRPAVLSTPELTQVAFEALQTSIENHADVLSFFKAHFKPYRIRNSPEALDRDGFLTGYYEPVIDGALEKTEAFKEPIFGRPKDLVQLDPTTPLVSNGVSFSSARHRPDETLEPYPDRASIDSGALDSIVDPIIWVPDAIEAFMIHVQGSATVRLPSGKCVGITYAGRNGRPYTSIGRLLIEQGEISESDMSLSRLKQWVRANGQEVGQKGRRLLQQNESFIFFALDCSPDRNHGPIGGEGIALTPLRSIAVDRNVWSYGLPFFIESRLPWQSESESDFNRIVIAQDTGSAIVGDARADIFFGSGDFAGLRAGGIRHRSEMTVLLPVADRGSQDDCQ